MTLTLDLANELYPLAEGDVFSLAIARNLVPEEAAADEEDEGAGGAKRVKKELWRSEDQGLAADYEYVMYGKVSTRLRDSTCI
jgi:DNA-directed RNA polymerase I, II, and III subunit RPABC3